MKSVLPGLLFAGSVALLPAGAAAEPASAPPAFAMCSMCHKAAPDEKSGLGPNLWGVGGRKAASRADYVYSPAMTASKIVWNKANLIAFITAPSTKVPGTKMAYMGQKDPKAAAAIAEYLLSLK